MFSWIKTVPYEMASGRLKKLYERIKGPGNNIDNIMMVHSLRPHTMEGHMALYKYVLHHSANTLPKWLLEAVGVYVSYLNDCAYCFEHHFVGMTRLLGDDVRAQQILHAVEEDELAVAFDARELAIFTYAKTLTEGPGGIKKQDIEALRTAGLDDGEILEINQVVSYFAYANRTVLGLGVTTEGDVLGTSPSSSDTDDWQHQ